MTKSAGAEKKEEPEGGTGRVLSLSDILYRSEANSDSSHDMSRSEGDQSDYDEELEVDIQTSMSDDEGGDPDSNAMRGSLNLRIHRVSDDKPIENSGDNGSSGTASSSQNDRTSYQVSFQFSNYDTFLLDFKIKQTKHIECVFKLVFGFLYVFT